MDFITQVVHQLQKMTEKEKDSWILSQAKLTAEGRQADFLLSLTGSKKVMGMPSEQEIAGFCQKVESGEIYLEYMTRYCEFDRAGHYDTVNLTVRDTIWTTGRCGTRILLGQGNFWIAYLSAAMSCSCWMTVRWRQIFWRGF